MNLYPVVGGEKGVPKKFEFIHKAQTAGLGLFTIEVSRSHSGTPQSVVVLWTNDNPSAETST
jgi:hypothetical protein